MKLLVFQHIACEHPGQLRVFLERDGVDWRALQLDMGETIPELADYDALWVMGGPMDVWEEEEHPWLTAEKAAIRRWVLELHRPFLGLCLGHQLLADALGGACASQGLPEIGVMEVELTDAGRHDRIFADMPSTQKALQWHSTGVTRTPPDAVVLARSDACPVQAMRVGDNAWSMQYHVEVEPDTVNNWGEVPAYKQALESTLGEGALANLEAEVSATIGDFAANAEKLYRNFVSSIK